MKESLCTRAVGDLAVAALRLEIDTWPKPGLVSPVDSGSHDDMDAGTFYASAEALRPYFALLAEAGAADAEMDDLRAIGKDAERAMLVATGGVNTHRGAIFGLGLLCAAAGALSHSGRASAPGSLGACIRRRWGNAILCGTVPRQSHGTLAWRRYGAGGARAEAAAGFPQLYRIGLPALRDGTALGLGDQNAGRVQACFALISELEDTNILHRGGRLGLHFARSAARCFLARGGVGWKGWMLAAAEVHRGFVARRLSPGGSADLLAATLLVDALEVPAVHSGEPRRHLLPLTRQTFPTCRLRYFFLSPGRDPLCLRPSRRLGCRVCGASHSGGRPDRAGPSQDVRTRVSCVVKTAVTAIPTIDFQEMSSTVAILCSGQGTQHAGMFDLVAQAPGAQPILEAARQVLDGKDPQQFVREAEPTTLFSNRTGQILCCAQALAAWAMIRPHLTGPVVVAGYSVGELAAWGCAGLLEPAEVLRLAVTRAGVMDEAGGQGSGLAALLGLNRTRVNELCRSHDAHIAIVNGEDFFVVGGATDALETILAEANQAGATGATILKVAIASHTPLLTEASRRFGEVLVRLRLPDKVPAGIRLLSGVDGDAVFNVPEGRRKLAAQISQTIQWAACLDSCRAAGVDKVLELGPGHALTNMARQFLPRAQIHSVDDFRTPAGVLAWLGRA